MSRVKRDKHPFLSVEAAIKHAKGKIDLAVICSPDHTDSSIYCWRQFLEKKLKCEVIDLSSQHHLQHASLAFYNSGFEKALVIVVDRNGTRYANYRESETVFVAEYPCQFRPIIKNFWRETNSVDSDIREEIINGFDNCEVNLDSNFGIVKVYETATSLIGQNPLENGKTMGLAAYGESKKFPDLFRDNYRPHDYLFSHTEFLDEIVSVNKSLQQFSSDDINIKNYKMYADYAMHVQQQTEEAVISLIQRSINFTGIKNICVTGGYGLNVVANMKYLQKFKDCNFYFEPLADDSGNSIGGAMLVYRDNTRSSDIIPIKDTFFSGKLHDISISGKNASIDDIVRFLIEQKSVGIYAGLSEAGPRALGNRSILFDARNIKAKEIVNNIKKREWYRPFACVVLEEDFLNYFEGIENIGNRFMTVSYIVKENLSNMIPGVVHKDQTCRVQVVNEQDKTLFHILKEFKKQTGISVLLNTSLNLAGEPLVETPEEALNVLNNSTLDILYFPEKDLYVS